MKPTILVLGASGLLGNAVFRVLSENPTWNVLGTLREGSLKARFSLSLTEKLIHPIDVTCADRLDALMSSMNPSVVVNCIGLTKHVPSGSDSVSAYTMNALLPHRLAALCANADARLIHVSTDCVFSGLQGMYLENDKTDAADIYGQSKAAGEVTYRNTITLRTSYIGHELESARGFLAWFLQQESACKGFRKAFFSGIPTVTLARIIRDIVIPNSKLAGLFHVASSRISKFDLLTLIAQVYKKKINILADDSVVVDRSLDGTKFLKATGCQTPDWPTLVHEMHEDFVQHASLYRPATPS